MWLKFVKGFPLKEKCKFSAIKIHFVNVLPDIKLQNIILNLTLIILLIVLYYNPI